jgi:hypothetical protein
MPPAEFPFRAKALPAHPSALNSVLSSFACGAELALPQENRSRKDSMKRLIILGLLTLFAASCVPSAGEQNASTVNQSFRCMWAGECSNH